MELGTGIFWSAIFLGMVALFIATKDRWNWKRILLWPLGVIATLVVVGMLIGYLSEQYRNRPKKLTELWGVSLTDTYSDVKFKKGEPTKCIENDNWFYKLNQTSEGFYAIRFKNDRVRMITYVGPMYNGPSIPGVGHYDSPQELDKKLGPPSYVSRSKDELRRIYSYEKFNIVAEFKHGEIWGLGIYDPANGPIKFKEESEYNVVEPSPEINEDISEADSKKGVADDVSQVITLSQTQESSEMQSAEVVLLSITQDTNPPIYHGRSDYTLNGYSGNIAKIKIIHSNRTCSVMNGDYIPRRHGAYYVKQVNQDSVVLQDGEKTIVLK